MLVHRREVKLNNRGKLITVPTEETVSDAVPNNWVDRFAPRGARSFLRLMRADRPIGSWLLLWPCWWSLALAADNGAWPNPYFMLLFAVGAILLRGAGCTLNDLIDRNFDAAVARTRSRPLPSGAVTPFQAILFLLLLLLLGLSILLQFNQFTIFLGLASLPVVAAYPLMKRFTNWPQLVLGLAFNWGALMGWAAVYGDLSWPAIYLYCAGIFWTLGYDTIYALQDMDDDALVGIKSTALLFKENARLWIGGFYVAAILFFLAAGIAVGIGSWYSLVIIALAAQFAWQLGAMRPDNAANCLKVFKSNSYAGWILFVGLIAVNRL